MTKFLVGLNKSYYNNTDLKFNGEINEVFENLKIEDNVFNVGAIQYSFGFDFDDYNLIFDHSKYIHDSNLKFEHTDGLNGLNLNINLQNNYGLGCCIYYPKTKLIYKNFNIDRYHLGGWSVNFYNKYEYNKDEDISLSVIIKLGYLNANKIKIKDKLRVSYKNIFFMISPFISINNI
jgi:hypothetical protein